MIQRVLIDSDVVLDVATGRQPFMGESKPVLAHMEERHALGLVSAHSITTMYYILRKLGGSEKALEFLTDLLTIISVATEGHNEIVQALDSGFSDFEDAVQYQCARANGCGAIITRNTDDYRNTRIPVYTPREYLALYASRESKAKVEGPQRALAATGGYDPKSLRIPSIDRSSSTSGQCSP